MTAGPRPVQVFGRKDSRETQRARRFFLERRIPVVFVDLASRPIAPTELRRFAERLGAAALVDLTGRRYHELGLAWLKLDGDEWLTRLLTDPGLLRLPLVRRGRAFVAGSDEAAWQALVARADQ